MRRTTYIRISVLFFFVHERFWEQLRGRQAWRKDVAATAAADSSANQTAVHTMSAPTRVGSIDSALVSSELPPNVSPWMPSMPRTNSRPVGECDLPVRKARLKRQRAPARSPCLG